MSDLGCLLECAKQCHEAKDAADILDIAQGIGQLDCFYQQGNQATIIQLVQIVINKYKTAADEDDKGQRPAQDIHHLYHSCRSF